MNWGGGKLPTRGKNETLFPGKLLLGPGSERGATTTKKTKICREKKKRAFSVTHLQKSRRLSSLGNE